MTVLLVVLAALSLFGIGATAHAVRTWMLPFSSGPDGCGSGTNVMPRPPNARTQCATDSCSQCCPSAYSTVTSCPASASRRASE